MPTRARARSFLAAAAASSQRLAAFLALLAPAQAGTLTVPGSAPTIQAAIVLAVPGDTILVAPGTYPESINYLGKRLVIEGTGGAAVTILHAGGAATAVTVNSVEPAGTALHGFTITGGTGQAVATPIGTTVFGGGGVLAGTGATLELRDCAIVGNAVASGLPSMGGGVLVNLATVSLIDCTLTGNAAANGAAVGATLAPNTISLSGCLVSGNTAGPMEFDAALDLNYSSGSVEDCVITDNQGTGLRPGTGTLSDCSFSGNTRWGLRQVAPGGTTLSHCSFLGNGSGGASLGIPSASGAGHAVNHCLFTKADRLHAEANLGTVFIDNCSFDGAHAEVSFGAAVARSCIFRNTSAPITGSPSSVAITYSDFPNAGAGTGNIDANPLWVDPVAGNYQLSVESPCIDSGDPALPLDPDASPNDMGALPFAHAWLKLGGGVAGIYGLPDLAGTGTLTGGETETFVLKHAPSLQETAIIFGPELALPFKGGTFWPSPFVVLLGLPTDPAGGLELPIPWPTGLPAGVDILVQCWIPDSTAPAGYAGSNGIRGTTP